MIQRRAPFGCLRFWVMADGWTASLHVTHALEGVMYVTILHCRRGCMRWWRCCRRWRSSEHWRKRSRTSRPIVWAARQASHFVFQLSCRLKNQQSRSSGWHDRARRGTGAPENSSTSLDRPFLLQSDPRDIPRQHHWRLAPEADALGVSPLPAQVELLQALAAILALLEDVDAACLQLVGQVPTCNGM